MNNASKIIYETRIKKGISIRELSKVSGVAERTIIFIEKNRIKTPQARTLGKLAKALDIDVWELI